MLKVGIIGAGISGLSSAYYLKKMAPWINVKIFERNDRVGGWIKTQNSNFLCEKGPRSIRATNKRILHLLKIIDDVGLGDKVVFSTHSSSSAQNRFIYVKDRLHRLPKGLFSLFRVHPPFSFSLAKNMINDVFCPLINEDISVDEFFRCRFGREVADYLVSSICRGIFASSSKTLSIRSAFPDIYKLAVDGRGSILKGMARNSLFGREKGGSGISLERCRREGWAAFSFGEGLEQLPRTMLEFLRELGVTCSLGEVVENVEFCEGKVVVVGGNGEREVFDHLISSIYCFDLAKLVGDETFVRLLESVRGTLPLLICS